MLVKNAYVEVSICNKVHSCGILGLDQSSSESWSLARRNLIGHYLDEVLCYLQVNQEVQAFPVFRLVLEHPEKSNIISFNIEEAPIKPNYLHDTFSERTLDAGIPGLPSNPGSPSGP